MPLLQKLLWQNKSRWQLLWALLGTFLGLFLVLASVQLYLDIRQLLHGDEGGDTDFLIINKKVNVFNTLGVRSTFSEEEIATIREQSFVQQVGFFEANRFRVSASSSTLGFYTELFFEAVEDAFIDVDSEGWRWQEGQRELPVILSKDYLALYNFGFAPSQGLPQFTPSTIQRVTLDVTLKGQGRQQTFKGRIVGFSDRINSIIVPMNFMQWANRRFGNEREAPEIARLILQTDRADANTMEAFLTENGYEVSGGRLISSQASSIVRGLLGLVLLIGGIIFLLSLIVFLLNYRLFVAQSQNDIQLLRAIGYHSKSIIGIVFRRIAILFVGVVVVSWLALLGLRYGLLKWGAAQGFDIQTGVHPLVIVLTIGIIFFFLGINYQSVRKSVQGL